MSGAEAIALLGLISSIITIIDETKRIYDAAADVHGLPEAFREVSGRLPIVENILTSAKQDIANKHIEEESCKGVKQTIEACERKANKLKDLFFKVIPGEGASTLEKYLKAVRISGKGNAVENLMKGILEDVQLLASAHGMKVITTAQQEQIARAIAEVSALPPSVPGSEFEDSGFSAYNSGPGTQYNAQGENIAQGQARQYNSAGGPMSFVNYNFDPSQSMKSSRDNAFGRYMRALELPDGSRRMREVRPACDKTFEWLFDNKDLGYLEWLQNDEPLYWIRGKAGSGKSTLMRFAYEDARTIATLQLVKSSLQLANADSLKTSAPAFFFHGRGSRSQKSLEGLLCTVLYQILADARELQQLVFSTVLESKDIGSPIVWDNYYLKLALRTICSQAVVPFRICLFLDALDEYEGRPAELVEVLELITTHHPDAKTKIKVCFSSRPLQIYLDEYANTPGLDIANQTKDDIKRVIWNRFQHNARMKKYVKSPKESDQRDLCDLEKEISRRAEGVFIWVRLVLDDLLDAFTAGDSRETTVSDLQNKLCELPHDLNKYYRHTIDRLDERYHKDMFIITQLVLCSSSPMYVEDFLAAYRCSPMEMLDLDACLEQIKLPISLETAERFVRTRSAGLIELIILPDAEGEASHNESSCLVEGFSTTILGHRVQFIHESVKSFFAQNYSYNHDFFDAYLCLQKFVLTCTKYLPEPPVIADRNGKYGDEPPSRKEVAGILSVSWIGELAFICRMEEETTYSISELLCQVPNPRYDMLLSIIGFPPWATFYGLDGFAVFAGLSRYLRERMSCAQLSPAPAVKAGLCWLAMDMSLIETSAHRREAISRILSSPRTYIKIGRMLLRDNPSCLSEKRGLELLDHLLGARDVPFKLLQVPEVREWFRLLVDHGADLDTKIVHSGGTFYHQEPRLESPVWRRPLHEAVLSCSKEFVDLLLSHGSSVNALDSDGRTPLDTALLMLRRSWDLLNGERPLDSDDSYPESETSRAVSTIASRLMDAGAVSTFDKTAVRLLPKDMDYLRSQRATIDERFQNPPRMTWTEKVLERLLCPESYSGRIKR